MSHIRLSTPTTGTSGAENTAAYNEKFDMLLSHMSTMASSVERALIEVPKSCAAAMHEAMHLVTGKIGNGKSTQ